MKGLKTNLLGLPTIVRLKLVARVNKISNHSQLISKRFSKIFQGLGTIGDLYTIKFKSEAQPQATYASRNVCLIKLASATSNTVITAAKSCNFFSRYAVTDLLIGICLPYLESLRRSKILNMPPVDHSFCKITVRRNEPFRL